MHIVLTVSTCGNDNHHPEIVENEYLVPAVTAAVSGRKTFTFDFKSSDGFKMEGDFANLLNVVGACANVCLDELAELCRNISVEVVAAPLLEQGLTGAEVGRALDHARIERISGAQ